MAEGRPEFLWRDDLALSLNGIFILTPACHEIHNSSLCLLQNVWLSEYFLNCHMNGEESIKNAAGVGIWQSLMIWFASTKYFTCRELHNCDVLGIRSALIYLL